MSTKRMIRSCNRTLVPPSSATIGLLRGPVLQPTDSGNFVFQQTTGLPLHLPARPDDICCECQPAQGSWFLCVASPPRVPLRPCLPLPRELSHRQGELQQGLCRRPIDVPPNKGRPSTTTSNLLPSFAFGMMKSMSPTNTFRLLHDRRGLSRSRPRNLSSPKTPA